MEDPSEDLLRKLGGRLLLEEEIVFFLIEEKVLQPENQKSPYDATAKLRWECQKWIHMWHSNEKVQLLEGMTLNQCHRCGAGWEHIHRVFCGRCKKECGYCRRCLIMGRVSLCSKLYWFPEVEERDALEQNPDYHFIFPSLTSAQQQASSQLLHFYRQNGPGEYLLWAVCGSGKTEVVFPLLREVLYKGERVLWATPRKDVVLELAPRLQQAFQNVPIAVLYGGSEKRWERGEIVLSTTHQALRFYHAFDLVIVDEVDSFPFHLDDMLPFAVSRARKQKGKTVYLTATPREEHKKRIGKRMEHVDYLPHSKIPIRYHGYHLPIPRIELVSKLNKKIREGKGISPLLRFLEKIEKQKYPGFIFLPSISFLSEVKRYIVNHCPYWDGKLETVHASDPLREEKVMALRKGDLQLLLTTTIMERGVTIPGIAVLVYQADAPIFDESALVQIAGRAGRSAQIPTGDVIFLGEDITSGMKGAVRQIKEMNRLARKEGYLQ